MSGSGQHLTVPVGELRSADEAPPRPRSASIASQHSQQSQPPLPPLPQFEEPDWSRRPSIRIERQPSRQTISTGGGGYFSSLSIPGVGRNRSNSDPALRRASRASVAGPSRLQQSHLPDIVEGAVTSAGNNRQDDVIQPVEEQAIGDGASAVTDYARSSSNPPLRHARTNIGIRRGSQVTEGEYENKMVDFLDVMDPEVSTLTTLTNVQNSLFVPDLGRYLNRRPTYILTQRSDDSESRDSSSFDEDERPLPLTPLDQIDSQRPPTYRSTTGQTLNTITSRVNDRYYAVLPHGVYLDGWSEEDKLEMNDLVRHMMHSRRSKFSRSMRGFGKYVRKPLGFFVTLYAFLITVFGLAWVLFLIGWINVGGRQSYLIHIIDSIMVALFAIVGDGLAPFRAVDTYHMCFIAHYHHLTWRLRKEQSLPALQNRSDLPGLPPSSSDASAAEKGLTPETENEYSVLTPAQQKKLEHHQKKFSKSHSFYKPHETSTHRAFSLRFLVAVVVLLDVHSLLQISLGACTWGISYHVRPFYLTTVILCCSITVNITAGILISVGDKRSRKKDVVEKIFRQQLTEEAMRKVERKKERKMRRELQRRGLAEEEIERSLSEGLGGMYRPEHVSSNGEVQGQVPTIKMSEEGK